jgi:hypothetical protein
VEMLLISTLKCRPLTRANEFEMCKTQLEKYFPTEKEDSRNI